MDFQDDKSAFSALSSVDDSTAQQVSPPTAPGLMLEIQSDATLGYASIQNSVPVIRALRLTNQGQEPIEGIEVLVNCNPRFAEGAKLRFDRLNPTETRLISPVDLRPDHSFLADLQESVRSSISVAAMSGTAEIAHLSQSIEVLAYDQWAGTRALPELLAAFCMPNNPAVDVLVGKASKLLRSAHPELSMSGYQTKSRDVVWKQISAIYSTVAAETLQYAEPPASFGSDGQKIRTPDRILEARVATCLDLAMLFAACFEQAGLRPVILMKDGHAWVGVWLHEACFSDPLTDDVQAVRKRVDSGEFLVFETTGVAQHHSHRPSLRIATEQGQAHLLEESSFRYAVDIRRARELQIKPLPSRVIAIKQVGTAVVEEEPAGIEATPMLPPLEASALTALDLSNDDTPEGRLAKWKSKLLDLTLRNKLLNFKPTKATLQFVAPNLAQLEDALSEGKEFRIRPLPNLMEGNDPRMAQVHANRGGRSPLDDMALDALGNKELIARVTQEALDGQHVLESLGWKIHRIWSTDWWLDPDREITKVIGLLKSLLEETEKEPLPEMAVDELEKALDDEMPAQERLQQLPSDGDHAHAVAPQADVRSPLIYVPSEVTGGDPVKFYEYSASPELIRNLRHIIDTEGPIADTLLFKKVARSWGLERTGARILERLRQLVPATVTRTTEGMTNFYWPAGAQPQTWSAFRVAGRGEESRRNVSDICLQEIGAIVKHVLQQAGGAPRQDTTRSVCRLVGMARTTGEAEARVGLAMDALIAAEIIQETELGIRMR